MKELLATWIAGVNRTHRVHHVVVPINFIDEGDSRLRILVRARHDSIPNIGSEDHSRSGRFFDGAIRKVSGKKCLTITECKRRTIWSAIYNVITIANWIVNRLGP